MPTNTLPIFTANCTTDPSEPQYVVSYPFEGRTYVVGFDSFNVLLHVLTSYKDADDNYLPGEIINRIVDFAEESMEWHQPAYPLGVSYVGDAACDVACNCDACIAERHFEEVWDLRKDNARLWWWFQGAKTAIGLLLATVALLIWRER